MIDPFAAALNELTMALDSLRIRYAVAGSLASSTHGIARHTEDGDLLCAIHPAHVPKLAETLGPNWYVDVEEMHGRFEGAERSILFTRALR